jgi:hypothetical protein
MLLLLLRSATAEVLMSAFSNRLGERERASLSTVFACSTQHTTLTQTHADNIERGNAVHVVIDCEGERQCCSQSHSHRQISVYV